MTKRRYDWKLKNCPFCGEKPYLTQWGWPAIQCTKCDLVMFLNDHNTPTEQAVNQWNKRKGE